MTTLDSEQFSCENAATDRNTGPLTCHAGKIAVRTGCSIATPITLHRTQCLTGGSLSWRRARSGSRKTVCIFGRRQLVESEGGLSCPSRSPAPPVGCRDKPQAHQRRAAAIDSPSNLSGHETTGQEIDALEEPYGSHQRHQNARGLQNNFHRCQISLSHPAMIQ